MLQQEPELVAAPVREDADPPTTASLATHPGALSSRALGESSLPLDLPPQNGSALDTASSTQPLPPHPAHSPQGAPCLGTQKQSQSTISPQDSISQRVATELDGRTSGGDRAVSALTHTNGLVASLADISASSLDPDRLSTQIEGCQPKRRKRRTKAQIAADEASKNEANKKQRKSSRSWARSGPASGSSSQRHSSVDADGQSDSLSSSAQLTQEDYELICCYLEDGKHYNSLFGSGGGEASSAGGGPRLTRGRAWDQFAEYLNGCNHRLGLTGRRLQQRVATYREKYRRAKTLQNHSAADILQDKTYASLAHNLDAICPCFNRMDAIFGKKEDGDLTPLTGLDTADSAHLGQSLTQDADATASTNGIPPSQCKNTPRHQRSHLVTDPVQASHMQSSNYSTSTPNHVGPGSRRDCWSVIPNLSLESGDAPSARGSGHWSGGRGTSTMAGAYEEATRARLDMMQRQIELEMKRFDLRLRQWQEECERRAMAWKAEQEERIQTRLQELEDREEAREKRMRALEDRAADRHARYKAVQQWLADGKTVPEVQILAQIVFGTP